MRRAPPNSVSALSLHVLTLTLPAGEPHVQRLQRKVATPPERKWSELAAIADYVVFEAAPRRFGHEGAHQRVCREPVQDLAEEGKTLFKRQDGQTRCCFVSRCEARKEDKRKEDKRKEDKRREDKRKEDKRKKEKRKEESLGGWGEGGGDDQR